MRKLNLKDYTAFSKVPDPMKLGKLLNIEFPYPVKDSLLTMMFSRELKLNGVELVKQQALALKIEACKEDNIILEEEEWKRLKNTIDIITGFNRQDVELVERINEAEVVEVEAKNK